MFRHGAFCFCTLWRTTHRSSRTRCRAPLTSNVGGLGCNNAVMPFLFALLGGVSASGCFSFSLVLPWHSLAYHPFAPPAAWQAVVLVGGVQPSAQVRWLYRFGLWAVFWWGGLFMSGKFLCGVLLRRFATLVRFFIRAGFGFPAWSAFPNPSLKRDALNARPLALR
jgi:hypothetical protein